MANGGNHSPKQTRLAWQWIDACSAVYKPSARLYHLAFVMADREFEYLETYNIYKSVLKGFRRYLSLQGIESSYQAAREKDGAKGEHLHVFLCVRAGVKRMEGILNRKNGWLKEYAASKGVKVYLNKPHNPLHGGQDYMALPASNPEKIADAKIWISYLFKRRSKQSGCEVYSCSRVSKRSPHPEAATNTNDAELEHADSAETMLTAHAPSSINWEPWRPKQWIEIMTKVMPNERPAWKHSPISPPIIIPSKPESAAPAAPEPMQHVQTTEAKP